MFSNSVLFIVAVCLSSALAQTVQLSRTLRVGVQGSAGGGGLCSFGESNDRIITQLNSGLYYSPLTARFVTSSDIDTATELANFDVIILSSSGQGADFDGITAQAAAAVATWVQAGGGLIVAADMARSIRSTTLQSSLQPVTLITYGATEQFCIYNSNPYFVILNNTHPVTQDAFPGQVWYTGTYNAWTTVQPGATVLANVVGTNCTKNPSPGVGIAVRENIGAGNGRTVYLSLPYCGTLTFNANSLRSGSGDRLLAQAVWWASKISRACPDGCANGGVCQGVNNCNCSLTGYTGSSCQTPVCPSNCNGPTRGTCVSPNVCNCTAGWSGPSCNVPVCNPPCLASRGSCIAPDTCNCTRGWTGPTCATYNDPCAPPCLNDGLCVAGTPPTCSCSSAFTGPQCQTPICIPSCQNGAACIAPNTCNCTATGYTGSDCTIPDCSSVGGCLNGNCNSPGVCSCQSGWSGSRCEIPQCTTVNCQNGGTCVSPNYCECALTGYFGPNCTQFSCFPACENGGVCMPGNQCNCSGLRYGGWRCDLPLCNATAGIICLNGGYCGPQPDQCDCTFTGNRWNGTYCQNPLCIPSCKRGGVCIGPGLCNCTGTGYNGTDCSNFIDVPEPSTEPARPTTYQEWLPLGLGEAAPGFGYDTIIAIAVGGCLLCCLCCCIGACLSFSSKNKSPRRRADTDLELH